MIDTFNLSNISYNYFLKEYILKNKPCIIRNFIDEINCTADNVQTYVNSKNLNSYLIGNITALLGDDTLLCDNRIVRGIKKDMEVSKTIRVWKHNKNNKTKWHYDGHGADILNICFQGSKDFYLAPPHTYNTYPLSTIAYDIDFKEKYKVQLNKNDMLYIPSFWFHKVITLEDNTINLNYMFYGHHSKKLISPRDSDIFITFSYEYCIL